MSFVVAAAWGDDAKCCQDDSPRKKPKGIVKPATGLAYGSSVLANIALDNQVLCNSMGTDASLPTAAIAALPHPVRVSAKELAEYYMHEYPFEAVWRWLVTGHVTGHGTLGSDASWPLGSDLVPALKSRDCVLRCGGGFREFAFTKRGGAVVRKLFFRTVKEWRAAVARMRPIRMDVGAVFREPQFDSEVVRRELVFDVDANDYDDVRTPATGECGAVLGQRGWVFWQPQPQ